MYLLTFTCFPHPTPWLSFVWLHSDLWTPEDWELHEGRCWALSLWSWDPVPRAGLLSSPPRAWALLSHSWQSPLPLLASGASQVSTLPSLAHVVPLGGGTFGSCLPSGIWYSFSRPTPVSPSTRTPPVGSVVPLLSAAPGGFPHWGLTMLSCSAHFTHLSRLLDQVPGGCGARHSCHCLCFVSILKYSVCHNKYFEWIKISLISYPCPRNLLKWIPRNVSSCSD